MTVDELMTRLATGREWRWWAARWLVACPIVLLLGFVLLGLGAQALDALGVGKYGCYESRPLRWEVIKQIPEGERGYSCTTR